MGKIAEKECELLELRKELENAEIERMSGVSAIQSFEFMPVTSEDVHEIPFTEQDAASENHVRKTINIEKQLKLISSDHFLANEIASGKCTTCHWGSTNYVPAWRNGRKYDPMNGRIGKIRAELRRGPRSIRELSSITGLAIDTIKDLVREMDKQGFFEA